MIKTAAMTGTSFSVTEARRCTPPIKITPQMMTSMTPQTHEGIPKAFCMVEPMEFVCTMQPMKPSASITATAKKAARNLPKRPLNAVVM